INAYGYVPLSRGIGIGYLRRKHAGGWQVRVADGKGGYWFKVFANADDYEPANGQDVLDFFSAQDRARAIARGTDGSPGNAPASVREGVAAYKRELKATGRRVGNATRVEYHLNDTPAFAAKTISLTTSRDFRDFRDLLVEKNLRPASVDRTMTALGAAMEQAA